MSQSPSRSPYNCLNTSKSKMQYSFSKEARFNQTSSTSMCDKIYELPQLFGHNSRKTEFGFGERSSLSPNTKFPSPSSTSYQIRSEFETGGKQKKGFGFGLGRDHIKLGGIFNTSISPAPGVYNIPSTTGTGSAVSLKPRLKELEPSYMKNPGPGAYEIPKSIKEDGKYLLSTVRNSLVSSFSEHKTVSQKKHYPTPGPGSYDIKENFDPKGTYFNSKFHDSMSRSFAKLERKVFVPNKDVSPSVGPGSYNHYSEFGA